MEQELDQDLLDLIGDDWDVDDDEYGYADDLPGDRLGDESDDDDPIKAINDAMRIIAPAVLAVVARFPGDPAVASWADEFEQIAAKVDYANEMTNALVGTNYH